MTDVRSDGIPQPGRISDQMFGSLLASDLCIAVLTGYNPNVFYELAVCQAFRKPVIILMEKGAELPFDIKDLRCVWYDFRPRPLMDGDYTRALVEQIRSLETSGWRAPDYFSQYGAVLRSPEEENVRIFDKAKDYGYPDMWSRLLNEAQQTFDIMGVSLALWRNIGGFGRNIRQKAAKACKVRILLLDPDHPVLKHMTSPDPVEHPFDNVKGMITYMHGVYRNVAEGSENIQVRSIRNGVASFNLTCTDQAAVAITYLHTRTLMECPLLECRKGSDVYRTLGEEFNVLWDRNERLV